MGFLKEKMQQWGKRLGETFMYEEVTTKDKKTGKEWRLFSVTSFAVVLMVCCIALFVGGYMYYGSYRTFAGEFSQTTSVNYRKGTVTVTTADEKFELATENIYYVYNCIINVGRGRIGEAPAREPDAVLEYEFGGRLELWETDVKKSNSESITGLFIRYSGTNGYEYAYDTDRLTLSRLPLTAKENME